eukprot:gene13844-19766_t
MLRVDNFQESIKFYEEVLGMNLIRTRDNTEYKYMLAFMGYGPEESSCVMELTWNYEGSDYTKGNSYEYVVLGTSDVNKTADDLTSSGFKFAEEEADSGGRVISIIDPNGY